MQDTLPGMDAIVRDRLEHASRLLPVPGRRAGAARGAVVEHEIADPRHHHHHFGDEGTGEITPFTDDGLEHAVQAAAARLGARLTSHEIVLRGRRR